MKKVLFPVVVLLGFCALFIQGCIKNKPYITTINPLMTASIGTYNFTAATVVPSTIDTQAIDTTHVLYITGNSSDLVNTHDKIVLSISHYTGQTGTFSIVQGQANAYYTHGPNTSYAAGGIVAITRITSNTIIGYFSFTTTDTLNVSNGTFTVGLP